MRLWTSTKLAAAVAGTALLPHSLWACAACYGQSDSAMAAGMNWGILSLLGMIVLMLGGVAGFFVFLIRRSTAATAGNQAALAESWDASWPTPSETPSGFPAQSLPRGSLKRESVLALRRKACAHSPAASRPLPAARVRS